MSTPKNKRPSRKALQAVVNSMSHLATEPITVVNENDPISKYLDSLAMVELVYELDGHDGFEGCSERLEGLSAEQIKKATVADLARLIS